jgi:2-dehydro-3-deoxygluconokinase
MKKVAVIGECMVELYQNKKGLYKQTFGGDTFNCSVYLKRTLKKAHVEYITVLADDELSNKMLDFLKKQDVHTTYIDRLKDRNPGLYIINTKKGERTFSYWRGEAASKELFLTNSLKKIENDLLSYDMIYFSAITLAIMSEKGRVNLFKVIKKARAAGVKIAFDSNYRPRLYKNRDEAIRIYEQAINYCDIFLPSIDDEKELWGDSNPDSIIKKSLNAGINEIILKCGKEDIIYHHENETKTIKTKRIKKIVDSTSAGDSFNGAYLASRLKGKTILKSIKKAKKLASKVIMYQGAIMPKDKHE